MDHAIEMTVHRLGLIAKAPKNAYTTLMSDADIPALQQENAAKSLKAGKMVTDTPCVPFKGACARRASS
jgi:hypothetical protein